MQYFPAVYPKGRGPPREYFFNVLNTVRPDYLKQILAHANEMRMAAGGLGQQTESIAISQFWEEQLKAMPYISSKSGVSFYDFMNLVSFYSLMNSVSFYN